MREIKAVWTQNNNFYLFIYIFNLSAIVHNQKWLCTVAVEPKKYNFSSTIAGYILIFSGTKNIYIAI